MRIKNFLSILLVLVTVNLFAINEPRYEPGSNNKNNFKEVITNLKTLSASFKQYNVSNNKKKFESSGKLYISKPNKFRWDIMNPNTQILVSDGKKFINYDVDLEQVSIKTINNINKDTPIYILSGDYESIEKNYNISVENSSKKSNKNLEAYILSPKEEKKVKQVKKGSENEKEQNISAVKLTFSDKILQSIEIYSNNKLITLINLSRVILNKNISLKKFKVHIPKNVEILK